MSHDEIGGPVTRKERRAAYGKRKPAVQHVFTASDHVRPDWTPADVTEFLESRARGYNGILRNILCTAAAMIREMTADLDELDRMAEDLSALEADEANEARPDTMIRAEEVGA